jgi:nicotinate-nucleotide pyrophosphorylase (carboxylating)
VHLFAGDSLDQLIQMALAEDIGAGDVTSESLIPKNARGSAICVAKGSLVLAGLDAAERTFAILDPSVHSPDRSGRF